jgi:hypothetical protein
MMWLSILPLIIDGLKAALRLVSELDDLDERREAKNHVRRILDDYQVHKDASTVVANLQQMRKDRR